jgi:hypothetical protein
MCNRRHGCRERDGLARCASLQRLGRPILPQGQDDLDAPVPSLCAVRQRVDPRTPSLKGGDVRRRALRIPQQRHAAPPAA